MKERPYHEHHDGVALECVLMRPLDRVESHLVLVSGGGVKGGVLHAIFLPCGDDVDCQVHVHEETRTENGKDVAILVGQRERSWRSHGQRFRTRDIDVALGRPVAQF